MPHGNRTALLYHWGSRLDAWITRHGVGVQIHSGSLLTVRRDVLRAASRSNMQGVYSGQSDVQAQSTRSLSQSELRSGRVAAQISLKHLPLER
jgi:hypothetical protein